MILIFASASNEKECSYHSNINISFFFLFPCKERDTTAAIKITLYPPTCYVIVIDLYHEKTKT